MKSAIILTAIAAAVLLAGCPGKRSAAPRGPASLVTPRFVDAAAKAGVRWTHNPCRSGRKLLPETYGGGGGFLDYNGDGRLDLILINGAPLPGYKGPTPRHALYRGNADGTFTDVTTGAGLKSGEYGQGLAVGDYDNDGRPDLYVTAAGKGRLYHNDHGRFVDVTDRAGVKNARWSTGAAWIDYDHDGKLDLFIADYVEWSPAADRPCGSETARQYCPPYQYRGAPPVLYRNCGGGAFEDVSSRTGVLGHSSKTLSVTPCDVNGDGWTDLYLANDTEPDVLLLNNRNGGFTDEALSVGVAVGVDGKATGSMGVDVGTLFADGRPVIAVGDFVGQGMSLFTPIPGSKELLFENRKQEAGLGDPTLPMSTFGVVMADVDLDGYPDLTLLNGHLDENLAVGERKEAYRQQPQMFQNRHDGTFADVAPAAGLTEPMVGRGLAVGDYDNDGRPDLLAFENGGPVRLWHNETPAAGAWLGVELVGTRSPRDGTGATVTVSGPGWSQTRFASTARSFFAANDPRIHFGVGDRKVEKLVVQWPSGETSTLSTPPINTYVRVQERKAR